MAIITRTSPRRLRRGFTLIELLVVITIITILIALLLPALKNARQAEWNVGCQSNLHQYGISLSCYFMDCQEILPYDVSQSPVVYNWGCMGWATLLHPYFQANGIFWDPATGPSAYRPHTGNFTTVLGETLREEYVSAGDYMGNNFYVGQPPAFWGSDGCPLKSPVHLGQFRHPEWKTYMADSVYIDDWPSYDLGYWEEYACLPPAVGVPGDDEGFHRHFDGSNMLMLDLHVEHFSEDYLFSNSLYGAPYLNLYRYQLGYSYTAAEDYDFSYP